MDRYTVKQLIDACFMAKRITETMPELPKGLKPRHIHVVDCIVEIKKIKGVVCVSDVSSTLKITTPSVTKLINELEKNKIINKHNEHEDKRVVSLSLTNLGEEYYRFFVVDYHSKLADKIKHLDDNQCKITIDTIEEIYEAIKSIEKEGLLNE